jgi:NADH-quinone oxidoreductase subunit K
VLSTLLFCVGVYGVYARRNAILVLMSVELMLNGANLNLVTFDVWRSDVMHSGQVMALFVIVIVIASAEVGLGLAIVLLVFRNRARWPWIRCVIRWRGRGATAMTPTLAIVASPVVLTPFGAAWVGTLRGRRLPMGAGGVAVAGTGAGALLAVAMVACQTAPAKAIRTLGRPQQAT